MELKKKREQVEIKVQQRVQLRNESKQLMIMRTKLIA
jgi:hypothetical protein